MKLYHLTCIQSYETLAILSSSKQKITVYDQYENACKYVECCVADRRRSAHIATYHKLCRIAHICLCYLPPVVRENTVQAQAKTHNYHKLQPQPQATSTNQQRCKLVMLLRCTTFFKSRTPLQGATFSNSRSTTMHLHASAWAATKHHSTH